MLRSGVPTWFRRNSLIAAAGLVLSGAAAGQTLRMVQPQKLAPYVSSPQPIVVKMLEIAGLKSGETLYDLAIACASRRTGLKAHVLGLGLGRAVDLGALSEQGRLLSPVLHPDPAHLHLTGTGLTHLGSAATRAARSCRRSLPRWVTLRRRSCSRWPLR